MLTAAARRMTAIRFEELKLWPEAFGAWNDAIAALPADGGAIIALLRIEMQARAGRLPAGAGAVVPGGLGRRDRGCVGHRGPEAGGQAAGAWRRRARIGRPDHRGCWGALRRASLREHSNSAQNGGEIWSYRFACTSRIRRHCPRTVTQCRRCSVASAAPT
jgi:hypothetical protein